jgi:transcriptional regulator with XRE-family HTH domain
VDVEHAHIGRRVHELRKWRRMTLEEAAGLVGRSAAWLSLIENGRRPVKSRAELEGIARALRVSPLDLTPDLPSEEEGTSETQSAMATLADLLGGWWVGEVPDASGDPFEQVLDRLRKFHAARNSSCAHAAGDYPTQVATLAPIIRDLLAAATDPKRRKDALPPLLTAYHVAGSIAARLRIPGMPSLAADRIRQVAAELDDPVWDAVSRWGRAHFLSGTNRARQYEMAVEAADHAPMDHPETRGMAHLTAGLAAAAQGQADVAETHLTEAAAVAELIEPDTSPWPSGIMQFGRTNVGIFRTAVAVELGEGGRVEEFVSAFRPASISRGRQASYWIDYGRGLMSERRTREKGLAALLKAEQLAPQQLHKNVFAREAITSLLAAQLRTAGGREVRGLAYRMGVAPTG